MTIERIKNELHSLLRRIALLEGRSNKVTTVTDDTIISGTGYNIYIVDSTAENITLSLPDVADVTGKIYIFKKVVSANNVVIQPQEFQTIDGATNYTMTRQYDTVTIISNGTEYFII